MSGRVLGMEPAVAWMAAKVLVLLGGLMTLAALLTWAERRGSAMIQDRIGPNRAALFGRWPLLGLVQPVADGIKSLFKEDLVPPHADAWLFRIAPLLAFVPALMGFAVIPVGRSFVAGGRAYHLSLLDPGNGMGMLFPMAVGAVAIYGVVVAGYGSNNKWSILGGLRSGANLISYEVGMTLALLAVLLTTGGYDPHEIVKAQGGLAYHVLPNWNLFTQPLGFLAFGVCMFAETNRLPFDFAEGESEIVAGYLTEFGAMKFALMYLAEYVHMITAAALLVTLYLGGWQVPYLSEPSVLLSVACFLCKLLLLSWVFIWVRWTLPRFRYDQLMFIGWKVVLPVAAANLLWHAWHMARAAR